MRISTVIMSLVLLPLPTRAVGVDETVIAGSVLGFSLLDDPSIIGNDHDGDDEEGNEAYSNEPCEALGVLLGCGVDFHIATPMTDRTMSTPKIVATPEIR